MTALGQGFVQWGRGNETIGRKMVTDAIRKLAEAAVEISYSAPPEGMEETHKEFVRLVNRYLEAAREAFNAADQEDGEAMLTVIQQMNHINEKLTGLSDGISVRKEDIPEIGVNRDGFKRVWRADPGPV